MIDYTNSKLEIVSVHNVGNKTNGEELFLSKSLLDISEIKVTELLNKFFLNPFGNPEFYAFTFTNEDFLLNPLYNFSSKIFDDLDTFLVNSVNIAKHLYEISIHPQIKPGDLFVAYFSNINIDNEVIDAIGIFKSENKQSFLKLSNDKENFLIRSDDGINTDRLDKGCLIFNTAKDSGFRVCIIDKSNKSTEAQYWKDSFLQLKPCSDDYHQTKEFMNITKNYVTKQLSEEFEVSRADQIDLLNRSVEYFKTHDNFNKNEFENEVFQSAEVINSFRSFDSVYRQKKELEISENFDISPHAVKKQARIFKSVLKLDRNFHIYIHGNKELIEKGTDENGRKYYKIYYEEES